MFVYCREVSDLSVGFEDCMLGTAILETCSLYSLLQNGRIHPITETAF
jgi:hypothetical protein